MTLELDSTLLLDLAVLEDEDLPSSLPSLLLDSGSEPGMTLEELDPSTSLRVTLEEELDSIDDEEFTELEDFSLLELTTLLLDIGSSFLLLEEPGLTEEEELPGLTLDEESSPSVSSSEIHLPSSQM